MISNKKYKEQTSQTWLVEQEIQGSARSVKGKEEVSCDRFAHWKSNQGKHA